MIQVLEVLILIALRSALDMGLPSSTEILGRFLSRCHSLSDHTVIFSLSTFRLNSSF